MHRVLRDPAVDWAIDATAGMLGLAKETASAIVRVGVPLLAGFADTDADLLMRLFAASRAALPEPIPDFYARMAAHPALRAAAVEDYLATCGALREAVHEAAADAAGTTAEQARDVLAAVLPAITQAFGQATAGQDELGFAAWLKQIASSRKETSMTPVAAALPRPDEKLEPGRFGTMRPVTPAPGFMVIMPIKPGMAEKVRAHGKTLAAAVANDPAALAILRLHYLRWAVFDDDTRFIYMGIFDTDFDKYLEDGISIFKATGTNSIFDCIEGCPEDWRENPAAVAKFFADHQVDSFCEYAEYPDVTGVEVVSALQVKQSFSDMLDQMQ